MAQSQGQVAPETSKTFFDKLSRPNRAEIDCRKRSFAALAPLCDTSYDVSGGCLRMPLRGRRSERRSLWLAGKQWEIGPSSVKASPCHQIRLRRYRCDCVGVAPGGRLCPLLVLFSHIPMEDSTNGRINLNYSFFILQYSFFISLQKQNPAALPYCSSICRRTAWCSRWISR